MLRGLDEVGWHDLSHAYGKARDTVKLLRQAGSPDPATAADVKAHDARRPALVLERRYGCRHGLSRSRSAQP